ncbi:glutathione S-transferase family protein [Phreatobacter stygius]|uniref:Glutathione S-transferase n=1 Tax=Phreatobacter stygius TaxID=1940610 RepID=A0A4D7AX25_9HYPH|nr:glutathione S-transferase N-terminal domain-containing protein [Phreatobacter stygius]QCI64611.1 glutathione S-transferase [Phreatobacter stygius]
MPLVLRSSPPSPFGRKIKLALAHLDLADRVTVELADTMDGGDALRLQNPLGKIPALILEDGTTIYDSRVILEYLDIEAGGNKIIPADPKLRIPALTLQALADGILDAGILLRYEAMFRSEDRREPRWLDHQHGKVARGLAALEAMPPALDVTVGTIALACALGYQDIRFQGAWRANHPNLVGWLDAFIRQMPEAWERTKPVL